MLNTGVLLYEKVSVLVFSKVNGLFNLVVLVVVIMFIVSTRGSF